ncbi:MAG TPA: sigma-70 family RNA polymerase sigma factor [Blastocatellia bacterium]|nr:sigma-70 family RNA polymerase sigma factor [Blastocatellia bacterium]
MDPNDSFALVKIDVDRLIIELLPVVHGAVRYSCRVYGHHTNQDEIRDLCQDAVLLLMENDYQRLRSFANRSSLETWLYTVVRHNVKLYLWKRRLRDRTVSVDDMSQDALAYQAIQEEALIEEDERKALRAVIITLPERKRRLMELMLRELKPKEIAKEMGIKVTSVYRQKSVLFKEIREILKGR